MYYLFSQTTTMKKTKLKKTKQRLTSVGKKAERLNLFQAVGNGEWWGWKTAWLFLKGLQRASPHGPENPLLGTKSKELRMGTWSDSEYLIKAVFAITKTLKRPRWMIDNQLYTQGGNVWL